MENNNFWKTPATSFAKTHLFRIRFFDLKKQAWNTELEIRAKRICDERIICFDEFQDFYVSKLFDEYKYGFPCNIAIEFYDNEFKTCLYTKKLDNYVLTLMPIDNLNQEDTHEDGSRLVLRAKMRSGSSQEWA